ncbi:dTDP-4-dehydrorhamnose 3,5-epimerase [Nonomuraea fuscirosea]|jgi:dTDP-4-dehydrorhamnose 3,5-epimerase|uniref:dTDP-4-dehydrorhamnose 3,5-epimerase family protein n=1 Tax=Nonomuraea fuscirosea TaxID=1291556 RepID=UPI002DDC2C32|nr:dTDP-4-dehydrorhamnose 3,5-epimerase [Nonomuraea fuscirosea]WSA51108.1 dTDP-4-dehydrorhamnose 3,5-epimerase [Nonomuraea fuscirosea]
MDPLGIDGAWRHTPRVHTDPRGAFFEAFRAADLPRRFDLAQVNCSVSAQGVLRGVHFADVPPGQAKYVMCLAGSVMDVVVDLRAGSPTFGRWEAVTLDDESRTAVLIGEGLGHAFMVLSPSATVAYLCSEPYAPAREHGVHPLDPDLSIGWPAGVEPVLSEKDAKAPTLAEALAGGLLPDHRACEEFYADHTTLR